MSSLKMPLFGDADDIELSDLYGKQDEDGRAEEIL